MNKYTTLVLKNREGKVRVIEGDDSPAQGSENPCYGTVPVQHFETLTAPYYAIVEEPHYVAASA